MKMMIKTLMLVGMIAVAPFVYAQDITIYDGSSSSLSGWHGQQENQETEPGTETGQVWDMESFFLAGSQLKMTGGYNFTTPTGYKDFAPGDIFFDVNGNGYDFVATVSSAGLTYDVYALPADTYSVYYSENANSNPWKYKSGGTLRESSLPVSYESFTDIEGTHYTSTLDISWLINTLYNGDSVRIHSTMECGNDNLMGEFINQTPQVPESNVLVSMSVLMGIVVIGLGRRIFKRM